MAQQRQKTPAKKTTAAGKRPATSKRTGAGAKGLSERLREPRVAATIGVVLAAGIIAFLVLSGGDDGGGSGSGSEPARGPEAVSVAELQELSDSVGHPVYWAGERPGTQYELTVSEEGNIVIRYLEPDAEIGSPDVAAFTVATYPFPDAYAALTAVAENPGAIKAKTPDGALVVTNESNPESVYVAYPGSDQQIEVFDPDPLVALETATTGQIEPIQ